MEKFVDLALPAGDESDCSDNEWDIGCVSERKTSGIEVVKKKKSLFFY